MEEECGRKSGLIKVGAQLTSVNGVRVEGLTYDDVVTRLCAQAEGRVLTFKPAKVLKRRSSSKSSKASKSSKKSMRRRSTASSKGKRSRMGSFKSLKRQLRKSQRHTMQMIRNSQKPSQRGNPFGTFETRLEQNIQFDMKHRTAIWRLAAFPKNGCTIEDYMYGMRRLEKMRDEPIVQVINQSYLHSNRAELGYSRWKLREIKRNKRTDKFEVRVWRRSKTFEPEKWFVGAYRTEREAAEAAVNATSSRDAGKFDEEDVTSEGALRTHFRVNVASDDFEGMDSFSRRRVVWAAIVSCLSNFEEEHKTCISRFGHATYVGNEFLKLPFFKFVREHFTIVCYTKKQWEHAMPSSFKPRTPPNRRKSSVRVKTPPECRRESKYAHDLHFSLSDMDLLLKGKLGMTGGSDVSAMSASTGPPSPKRSSSPSRKNSFFKPLHESLTGDVKKMVEQNRKDSAMQLKAAQSTSPSSGPGRRRARVVRRVSSRRLRASWALPKSTFSCI